MKVIIVDDEPLAQDILETYISQLSNLELVAKCSNALEANEALKNNEVDLMFLDIQMPQLTGIEFLKALSNPPEVIFTTAYADYAVEGFELNALDYLLKPIPLERFMKAVNKAEEKIQTTPAADLAVGSDYIFVKADKKLIKIMYDDIIYIEGLKDYVQIRLENGSRVITLQTMKSLEEKLPSNLFKRIHRSFILKLNKIKALSGNMVEVIEKKETKLLPIGKNYKDELLEIIEDKRL